MKNLFFGSLVLLFFAFSIFMVQVSCSKTTAQSPGAVNQLNKILTVENFSVQDPLEFWIMDYDGSNPMQIIPQLPAGVVLSRNSLNASAKLSPDGAYLFFRAGTAGGNDVGVYRCDISGANTILVKNIGPNDLLAGVY